MDFDLIRRMRGRRARGCIMLTHCQPMLPVSSYSLDSYIDVAEMEMTSSDTPDARQHLFTKWDARIMCRGELSMTAPCTTSNSESQRELTWAWGIGDGWWIVYDGSLHYFQQWISERANMDMGNWGWVVNCVWWLPALLPTVNLRES